MTMDTLKAFISSFVCVWGGVGGGGCSPHRLDFEYLFKFEHHPVACLVFVIAS